MPKTSSRDRTLQRAAEQILDVLVPEMAKQLVEVPETVSRDGVQQRTVEQIVDAPVPQAVKELADVFRVFSQDRIQQRAVEQTIEIPAVSLDENIEVPVAQTPEKAQQVANTLVQHDVNTVEVERSKLVKEEKINQVTKHVKVHRCKSWRRQPRSHWCSSLTRLMTSPSWCRDRFFPWPRLFRRPWRFHSCSVLTRRSMTLLCRFHRCRSLRRQLRSHSCRPLRKQCCLRPERPRRSRASRPLRV